MTVSERSDEIKVGWVYTDKRGIDVLIVRKVVALPTAVRFYLMANDTEDHKAVYPFRGVAMGNQIALLAYTPCGKFSLHNDQNWENDLLVETGKLWVAGDEVTRV